MEASDKTLVPIFNLTLIQNPNLKSYIKTKTLCPDYLKDKYVCSLYADFRGFSLEHLQR